MDIDSTEEEVTKCTWTADTDPATSPHNKIDWVRTDKVLPNILAAVGNTPMIKLNKIPESHGIQCEMYVKCEYLNPAGSEKDRFGCRAIAEAERTGKLHPGDTLIVPSSGNTGVSLATVAAVKGYPIKIVTPDDIMESRKIYLNLLGAEIVKVPKDAHPNSKEGMFGICEKLNHDIPSSMIFSPYENIDNPLAHYDGTAEEILDALDGQVDMLVVSCRSGGVVTGIGRKLKEKCPNVIVVGIDEISYHEVDSPKETMEDSVSLDYSETSSLQNDAVPTILDKSVIDRWVQCPKKDGFRMARRLINEEGLFCGIYSGIAVEIAVNEAKILSSDAKCVVVLLDSIRDYMNMFISDSWLEAKGIMPCNNPEDYWWWDVNISELRLKPLIVAEDEMTIHNVIHVMKKYKINQLPVVNKHKSLIGAVTMPFVLNKILSGDAHSKDPVSKAYISEHNGIEEGYSATLGLAMRTLELQNFAILYTVSNTEYGIIKKVVSVIKHIDILLYIGANDPDKV